MSTTEQAVAGIDNLLEGDKSQWAKSVETHRDCGGEILILTIDNDDRWPGYKMGACGKCHVIGTLDQLLEPERVGPQPPRPLLKWPGNNKFIN